MGRLNSLRERVLEAIGVDEQVLGILSALEEAVKDKEKTEGIPSLNGNSRYFDLFRKLGFIDGQIKEKKFYFRLTPAAMKEYHRALSSGFYSNNSKEKGD